jgi:integrase
VSAPCIARDGELLHGRSNPGKVRSRASSLTGWVAGSWPEPDSKFSFGVERGMLDASPFISLPRPGGTEKSRNRKLDDREVRVFWKKLTSSRLSAEVRIALKLILITAQRPGEVALAARDEFDLERRMWTIPPERSKNGKPHPVPLSDLALTLLNHLKRRFGETQYLIPSRC